MALSSSDLFRCFLTTFFISQADPGLGRGEFVLKTFGGIWEEKMEGGGGRNFPNVGKSTFLWENFRAAGGGGGVRAEFN